MGPKTLILLLAAVITTQALAHQERFFSDEAFFMTFSRNAAVNGDWLLSGDLDKTPLSIYLHALSLTVFAVEPLDNGVLDLNIYKGELSARVTGVLVSWLIVACIMALAQALYHDRHITAWAGLLAALSPYTIAFSATAFTDMPMLLGVLLALNNAVRGKPAWAGFWAIMAFAAKQQAFFYWPLLLLILLMKHTPTADPYRTWWRISTRFVMPLLLGGAVLLLWDGARPEISIFTLAAYNNTPGNFYIPLHEMPRILPVRMAGWWNFARVLLGVGIITAGLMALSFLMMLVQRTYLFTYPDADAANRTFGPSPVADKSLLTLTRRPKQATTASPLNSGGTEGGVIHTTTIAPYSNLNRYQRTRLARTNLLLWVWLLAYAAVHIMFGFNIYDRYVLLALPVVVLLAAWALSQVLRWLRFKPLQWALTGVLLLVLGNAAWLTALGHTHIGGDLGRHRHIDELAYYLNELPVATVIYDHGFGWALSYYMGQWSDKRRVYYPTPGALAHDAVLLDEYGTRYFLAPQETNPEDWLSALREVGFTVRYETQFGRFQVYTVQPDVP